MLKIYNTLTRKKEVFRPRKGKKVNLFVCGPTVYDFPHLGHARTYTVFDMIAKYLRENGYNLFYLQNITDIDDKIIKRAKERKISAMDLARQFEKEYFKDMKSLKIDSVTKYARATEHIKEIISQTKRLLEKGYAYKIKDGIYYDVSKFKDYGKLARRTIEQAEDGVSRIDESLEKRNRADFCLWKFSKSGEPKWQSPFGWGRPGWHIEDTAITEKYFGSQYDIHGGARDLIFPHHEAEISQMEAISGKKPMVKYWFHTGFLTIKGQKMSKSLGNFITIRDFLKKHSPRILRLFVIKTHYRSPIDYQEKVILQIKRELEKIDEFIDKVKSQKSKGKITIKNSRHRRGSPGAAKLTKNLIVRIKRDFKEAMGDDFNTPKAIASVFDLINKGNTLISQNKLGIKEAKNILEFLKKIDKFFGFIFWPKEKEKISVNLLKLVKLREKYRQQKKWKLADQIRQKIKDLGYQIEDTREGSKIKYLPTKTNQE